MCYIQVPPPHKERKHYVMEHVLIKKGKKLKIEREGEGFWGIALALYIHGQLGPQTTLQIRGLIPWDCLRNALLWELGTQKHIPLWFCSPDICTKFSAGSLWMPRRRTLSASSGFLWWFQMCPLLPLSSLDFSLLSEPSLLALRRIWGHCMIHD